jgi:succinate dehydrogenase/fumarate reductase iron-sulfur protein
MSWFRRKVGTVQKAAVTVRVRRGSADDPQHWQAYNVAVTPKMSVLDALFDILEGQDPTLSFRYSCRAQMCGSCAMLIDGREALACGRRLETLGATVTVEPLRHLPLVKDLVVDMAPFFAGYAAVDPTFAGGGTDGPAVIPPSSGLRAAVDQHLGCISCGACYSACPIVGANPRYAGPAALNRVYTLVADVRDEATARRLALVSGADGIFSCRCAGNCVDVCPVNIAPMFAIQRLRRRAVQP